MPNCALYSLENKHKTGNGTKIVWIKYKDDDKIDNEKKRLRIEQKEKNRLFKEFVLDQQIPKNSTARRKMAGAENKANEKIPKEIIEKSLNAEDILQKLPLVEIRPEDVDFIELDNSKNSGNSICLIGSSKAGKSTVMMALFNKYFNNKKMLSVLFSINSHIPIYKNNGDLVKVNKFVNESEKLIKNMKKINMDSSPPNKWNFCILLDDIVDARYSRVLNALLLAYRNSNFSSVISIQYPKLLSKSARCSANNLLFFSQNLQEGIEVILKSFLAAEFNSLFGITKFNHAIQAYRLLTKDHSFLYYHPMTQTLKRYKLII